MRKELDEKLQQDFPWLKRPELHNEKTFEYVKGYSIYENYGFEVGDGWYQLLHDLCSEIEEIYKEYKEQSVTMKLAQVKSKFAGLRWYYDLPGKEQAIHAFDFIGNTSIRMYPEGEEASLEEKLAACVKKYEKKSSSVCEQCGAENAEICNEPPVFRWIRTLCPACKADRIALYNKKMEERENFKEEMLKKKEDYAL